MYILIVLAPLFLIRTPTSRVDAVRPRILIIPQFRRIGDLVCATPMFSAIKEKYPGSFLAIVVAEYAGTKGLIEHDPNVDEVIVLKNSEYLNFFRIFNFFKRIKSGDFDWSININTSSMGTVLSVFGQIPNRVKITRKRRPFAETLSDWMNTHVIRYEEGEYIPTLYLKTLRFLDISLPKSINKRIYTSPESDEKAQKFLNTHKITSDDYVVGISVTAGNKIKEWQLSKFAELAWVLIEKHKAKIVFIGSPKDEKKIRQVNEAIGNQGIIATKNFSLGELPSLLKRLSVFISADTGPMHIAHAVGTPLIDIIGPVDPHEQAPMNDPRAIIVTPPSHIKPTIFAFRRAGNPELSRHALETISVQDVLGAFENLYKKSQNKKM